MTRLQAVTAEKQKQEPTLNRCMVDAEEVQRFVARVGLKVRQARQAKSISRRELSERSGVSQRYLAQLESGAGNISIALLYQLASALGRPAAEFLLETGTSTSAKAQRICLIGLRGAGKSTLGSLMAHSIDRPFLELNALIEEQSGIPVSEVISLYGQEGYRELEQRALETVIQEQQSVILAVGGGIVSEPETFRLLLSHFHTVWLKATPQEHMDRVRKQGDDRPMAGHPKAMEQLQSILTNREFLYARADAMLDTSGRRVEESLEGLIAIAAKLPNIS